ncbi:extracellular solute-binding protein [Arsenicitalea aurantiaca]|uniref:Extracellular solute-binding protein n=1 Tax=Arsenicitalea aurantiaca TaxID=1783274 RepID=A0A433XL70_9HYPH|nr:extracellular solute-binding protein [Arsenicitalea aurantiaca]RUT34774.1 extracellular solute-binding protein [Arsenicitalea aurantiaca]
MMTHSNETGVAGPQTRRTLLARAAGLGVALIALGAAMPALAQEGASEELIAAAQAEGTLTYYHTSPIDLTNNWTAAFTEKYGIPTQNVRGPSYPLWERWLTEERVGQHIADVIQITDTVLIEAADEEGLIADYTPPSAAGIRPTMKKEGVWYTVFVNAMGIAWNADQVTEEEDAMLREADWSVLTDPRWAGRFATGTPASGGSSYSYVYMFLGGERDQFGPEFLEQMAELNPQVYESKAPMYDRMAAGEHAIVDQASQSDMGSFYLRGAPVRWVFPSPTPANLTVQTISENAPHPNAARLFQEWATSPEGQAEWFKYAGVMSAREDTVDPRKEAGADWYQEDWYADPEELYLDYLSDPAYVDPAKPIIGEWNAIFGR